MEENQTLFEAIIFPELLKMIKLHSPFMVLRTFTYQKKNFFTISTNMQGNILVDFNLDQYLDESRDKESVNDKNGRSNIGNSNLIISNDISLKNNTPINDEATVTVPNRLKVRRRDILTLLDRSY